MKTATVAAAKSHLSAMLAEIEAGKAGDAAEGIVITRRGKPVARLVPEPESVGFDWKQLRDWVSAPPVPGLTVAQMREQDML